MARTLSILSSLLILAAVVVAESNQFSTHLSPSQLGLKKEKLTHLHFYFHDIASGKNPTTVLVAQAAAMTNTSETAFGKVFVMDDPLTVGPELSSQRVGSSQGIDASVSQTGGVGFLMVLNFVFTEGKFNGSTLSVLGHNAILSKVREMPIVGGSGVFRFSRGYAQATTFSLDPKTLVAVVEFNVYVFHY